MGRNGASANTHGKKFERDCVNHLAALLDLDLATARSVPGTHGGTDIITIVRRDPDGRVRDTTPHVHGWSLECKAHARKDIAGWMRQAERDADGSQLYAVIEKIDRQPIGNAAVHIPAAGWHWWTRAATVDDDRRFVMNLDAFAAFLQIQAIKETA